MKKPSAKQIVQARFQTYLAQIRLVIQCEEAARRSPTDAAFATLRSAQQQAEYFFGRLARAVSIARTTTA